MSIMRIKLCLKSLFVVLLAATSNQALEDQGGAQKSASAAGPVRVAMRNVQYHYTDSIAVHIQSVQGELIPTRAGEMVVFDDKTSFALAMAFAEISMSCDSLSHVLNEDVFGAADAPLKELSIQSKGNSLIVKGKLRQKGNLPFESTGVVSATADGRLRLHTERVKAAHLPVKGLMDLLGIELASLISTKKVRGVSVDKDDLILDPQEILPLPRIEGHVTAVRIQGNDIVQTFGHPQPANFAAHLSGNYMAYRDNELRFGKLTMHDTDMTLIDMDPQDPFDFYLDRYKDQLIAGYSKTTPTFGLRVFMRDYNKLKSGSTAHKTQRE
jgi:hypothetical protein